MSRLDEFYGANDPKRLFGDGLIASTPFPQAGRRKDVHDYEQQKVHAAVADDDYPITPVDPRILKSSQAAVTHSGVQHYLENPNVLYADQHQAGNRVPVVYHRQDDDSHIILSGHHRATTALLQGRPFEAKVVQGSWGEPRTPHREPPEAQAQRDAEWEAEKKRIEQRHAEWRARRASSKV